MEDLGAERMCSNCGGKAKAVRGIYRFNVSGLDAVLVGVQLIRCEACDNEDPVLPNMDDLMKCLAQAVIEKPWRLSGVEIRFLRKYLGMNGEMFSSFIGVDKTTISKWENCHETVGETSDKMIRALALMLGDGLRERIERAAQTLPQIKSGARKVEYRYDAGTREVEYA
jgi:putative zinc finger/helix-turn-helix YgiT family protein